MNEVKDRARDVDVDVTPIDAAILDMDGVITDTAEAHAAAWKRLFDDFLEARAGRSGERFQPFDAESDYRRYVDGKPRYDGVQSFLEARGIELPWGDAQDGPDRETVCGLGNRKNGYFEEWLENNRVRTFPDAIAFVNALRRAGKAVAVFSSSRNARAVLENAAVLDHFDARVDGIDLGELDMPGKPDPAMLREAARRLDAEPAATAVVEDAVSGVQAGAAGRFGLVIGVARARSNARQAAALRDGGADVVVGALSELRCARDGLSLKTLRSVPAVRDREPEIRRMLAGKRPAVFLDYDGTLTPIVEDYTKAVMADDMREAVARLAARFPVAIISGRDLENLRDLVRIESAYYAGSHGFDLAGPDGWRKRLGRGETFLPELDAAERALRERLDGIEGHAVERKAFAIAVHYRRVAEADIARVEGVVDEVVAAHDKLRKGHGKKVFQVQPDTDWDKGHAVAWLLDHLGLRDPDVLPLYIGDDITDEDAFRALSGRGLGVVLRDGGRATSADYALSDPDEVRGFLDFLAATGESSA